MIKLKKEILALEKKHGKITVKCEGSMYLPIDLLNKFQGKIKKISEANKLKMIRSIYKRGFFAPFFAYDNKGDWMLLDGHSRRLVLNLIRECGGEIPGQLPVCAIQADSEAEAKKILLSITSQFGTFDLQELADWVVDIDKDIADSIRLVDNDIDIIFKETDLEIDLGIEEPKPKPEKKKEPDISPDVFVSHNPEKVEGQDNRHDIITTASIRDLCPHCGKEI